MREILFSSARQRRSGSKMSNANEINRRSFCLQACQAASCVALGSIIGACGGGGSGPSNVPQLSIVNGNVSGSAVGVQIDSTSPLAAVGGAAMVRSSGGLLLVSRTAQETCTALTSTCAHEACTISGFDNTNCVGPCHGQSSRPPGVSSPVRRVRRCARLRRSSPITC